MKILGYEIHLAKQPVVDCPSTQAVHSARNQAYREKHAQLLAELHAVVGRPLPAVEKIAGTCTA